METRWKDSIALAYAAGFLDGEGYVGIIRNVPKKDWHSRGRNIRYEPCVVLTNTALPVLEWFVQTFGGSLKHRPPQKEGWKEQWKWTIGNRQAAEFCAAVLPYLKVKQEQAKIVIEFMDGKTLVPKSTRYAQVPPEELAWREAMWQRIYVLNDSWQKRRIHQQRLNESAPSPADVPETGEATVRAATKVAEAGGTETTCPVGEPDE